MGWSGQGCWLGQADGMGRGERKGNTFRMGAWGDAVNPPIPAVSRGSLLSFHSKQMDVRKRPSQVLQTCNS